MRMSEPSMATESRSARPFALIAWSMPILATALAGAVLVLSIVDHAVWRPLPYPDPGRIATVFVERDGRRSDVPSDLYRTFEAEVGPRALLAATRMDSLVLQRDGGARRVVGAHVTARWFDLHGMAPHMGRYFVAQDYAAGDLAPVVLSYRGWKALFDADPGIVGGDITLDGVGYRVVGVSPPGLDLQFRADVAFPYRPAPGADDGLYPVARVLDPDGIAALDAIAGTTQARLSAERPEFGEIGSLRVRPLVEVLAESVKPVSNALLVALVAVLLAAAASFINQVVLAAVRRERRLATELAIGATPRRLALRGAVEACVAVVTATLIAVLAAHGLLALLPAAGLPWVPRGELLSISPAAVGWTIVAAAGMASTGALVAASVVARQCRGFAGVLSTRGATASRSTASPRRVALLVQTALSASLVLGCVQVVDSLRERLDVDLGFDPTTRWTANVAFPPSVLATGVSEFEPSQRERFGAFLDAAERALEATPGVSAAGFAFMLPVVDRSRNVAAFEIVGEAERVDGAAPGTALLQFATPGYFRAMEMRLLAGQMFRPLATEDRAVVLINEAMARTRFAGRDPVGARLAYEGRTVEVIGVVSDIRQSGVHAPTAPEVYVPANAYPSAIELGLVVDGRGALDGIGNAVRAAFAGLDPTVPVYFDETMSAALDRQVADHRFLMLAIWLFGLTASISAFGGLLLASLQTIAQEREALSVRAALGATGARLAGDLGLRYGAILGTGVIAGSLLQLAFATPALNRLVPDAVGAGLVATVVATLALLGGFALAIAPAALRAYRIDPREALRG